MTKKKKFTVYANCQSDALASLLLRNPSFEREYELVRILPVHLLKKENKSSIRKIISEVDLCVSQPVSTANGSRLSTEEITTALAPNSPIIKFPSIYFDGYFPHLVPLAGMPSIMNNAHDINVMVLNQKGYKANDIYNIISSNDFYNSTMSNALFEKSIDELREREGNNKVDILVSSFILAHYKESILFNTYNHPSNKIVMHIAAQVCKMLNIDNSIYAELNISELLGAYRAMPYQSTTHHLNILESIVTPYHIEGKQISHRDIVGALDVTYSQHVDDKVLSLLAKKHPLVIKNLQKY